MDAHRIEQLAQALLSGRLPLASFVEQLAAPATRVLEDASIDLDRRDRCGYPEVVYGEGKTVEALGQIFEALLAQGTEVLATRVDAEKAEKVLARFPAARYNAAARTVRIVADGAALAARRGRVAVVSAGTSDRPVAEEARETLDWMRVETDVIRDVGVAGPHRLVERLDVLRAADAVVVLAGMEGALPSVVGGYVACPVIAVPTSVGYGASFHGVAALLGMLNSCAANVTVVNIDAGFKGGYVAGLIARAAADGREGEKMAAAPHGKAIGPSAGTEEAS